MPAIKEPIRKRQRIPELSLEEQRIDRQERGKSAIKEIDAMLADKTLKKELRQSLILYKRRIMVQLKK